MSDSPKLCIPAYELVQALYRPEEAAKVYQQMSPADRKKTEFILARLLARKESNTSRDLALAEKLPHSIVEEDMVVSPDVCDYFRYLGYTTQQIPASINLGIFSPVLIIEW